MHKAVKTIHNFRGQASGTTQEVFLSFPQLRIYPLLIHELFTVFPRSCSQPVWRILPGITDTVVGYPRNPHPLLLLSTSFKNLIRVVKELFRRGQLTIIGGQIGVS